MNKITLLALLFFSLTFITCSSGSDNKGEYLEEEEHLENKEHTDIGDTLDIED